MDDQIERIKTMLFERTAVKFRVGISSDCCTTQVNMIDDNNKVYVRSGQIDNHIFEDVLPEWIDRMVERYYRYLEEYNKEYEE